MSATPIPPSSQGLPPQKGLPKQDPPKKDYVARKKEQSQFEKFMARAPVHFAVVAIAVLWTLPTLGLLISSFRPPDDLISSGWWTVFLHPLELTRLTLSNYQSVLNAGMGQAFLTAW